jgi:hypothetical protein
LNKTIAGASLENVAQNARQAKTKREELYGYLTEVSAGPLVQNKIYMLNSWT